MDKISQAAHPLKHQHKKCSILIDRRKQMSLREINDDSDWVHLTTINQDNVLDKRTCKRKRAITKCCLTGFRSIEKRHGV